MFVQGQDEYLDQTFESLDAREMTIEDLSFENCTFVDGQFAGAELLRCRFMDCVFKKCDLSNTEVTASQFRDVRFEESKLVGVNWPKANSVSFLDLENCVMNYSNFIGLDLRKSKIRSCTAREVEFAQANLTEVDARGTDFAGSTFSSTNLTKADLRGAINYSIRPNDNTLKKARFSLPEATSLLYGLDILLED